MIELFPCFPHFTVYLNKAIDKLYFRSLKKNWDHFYELRKHLTKNLKMKCKFIILGSIRMSTDYIQVLKVKFVG